METGINFGHTAGGVKETRELIADIIHAHAGDNVKIAALKAMTKALAIHNSTISGVHIDGSQHTHVPPINWEEAAKAFGFTSGEDGGDECDDYQE